MADQEPNLDFETRATHSGLRQKVGDTIATIGPIVASSTFTADSVSGVHRALEPDGEGFAYSRNGNPTVAAFEAAVASLEGSDGAVAFGSGMGAIHAALLALELAPGDIVVAAEDLYGVSRALFAQLANSEVQTVYVDPADHDQVEAAVRRREARVLFFESVSNPLIRVSDVGRLAEIGRAHRTTVIVDNTFATPFLCRPLEYGVDIVAHSATKYLAGHGDVTAGVLVAGHSFLQRIRSARTVAGGVLSPFDAWLAMRGLRTLHVRMERHCESALSVARWLEQRTWVERVYYPGLDSSPHHELAADQFGGRFGGMLAFDLRAGREQALAFMDALELVTPGTSLGDVESLALYPPLSSHRTLEADALRRAGIGEGLIRISIGLESPRDLMVDLERAARRAILASTISAVST
jgi:cystathionine gamma-synthase